jgi:RNA polymerase sigma-70 factor (ECF subfamily)
VRKHLGAAYAAALAILGRREDAEDVAQDTMATSIARLDECRDADRFRAWVVTIARNRARNAWAARRIRAAEPLDEGARLPGSAWQDPEREAARIETAARLLAALSGLSEVQRTIVLLHDLEGWKHREIGQVLDLPEVTSRQVLFVARRKLRERLSPDGIDGGDDGR